MASPEYWDSQDLPAVLALIEEDSHAVQRAGKALTAMARAGSPIVLIAPDAIATDAISLTQAPPLTVLPVPGSTNGDQFFEDLYRALIGPLPRWLDIRMRPSQVQEPTGVAWWEHDVVVADPSYEHVVRIGPSDSAVLVPGLTEPQHVTLDRRLLAIANKGADEVLVADIVDGMATNVRSLTHVEGALLRPNYAQHSNHISLIVDTDNARVLYWHGALHDPQSVRELVPADGPFSAPCGAHFSGERIVVADTFNHRIVFFDLNGVYRGSVGEYGDGPYQFRFPVGAYQWNDLLFVSDEESKRLRIFRWEPDPNPGVPLREVDSEFVPRFLRSPFGLSVNRENRLAAGDRDNGCD